jgi:phosphatidate cytidylyltransferase
MLLPRIVTAVILLLIILPVLFLTGPVPFYILAGLFLAAAMWEWSNLNKATPSSSLFFAALWLVCASCLHYFGFVANVPSMVWLVFSIFWFLFSIWMLNSGLINWTNLSAWLRVLLGFILLIMTWLAVSQARAKGINFLLSTLALVWAADIGAYIFGKTLGGKVFQTKLAPSISPGKSKEGAIGGCLSVFALAYIWMAFDQKYQVNTSFYSLVHASSFTLFCFAIIAMVGFSIAGDLVESLIKRTAGAKDSSRLLPGHGGVLDRIDALLPTLPLALALSDWM